MSRKAGCWSKKIRIPGFALWALLFALCYPTAAQQQTKVSRIGFLGTQTGLRLNDRVTALQQGLRELGYVEGKNLSIEYRWADGNVEKLPSLAAELTNLNVELIIVTGGVSAIAAVRNATRTIPIVFAGSNDPVASGFVASLARPGGNLTGLTIGGPELYGKRVEILKEVVPGVSRAGLLLNPMVPSANMILEESLMSGRAVGLQVQALEIRTLDDFERAFDLVRKAKITALSVMQSAPITAHQKLVLNLAAKDNLATMFADRDWPNLGGLMSYGPNYPDVYRQAATYVDKILRGAKPADLPWSNRENSSL